MLKTGLLADRTNICLWDFSGKFQTNRLLFVQIFVELVDRTIVPVSLVLAHVKSSYYQVCMKLAKYVCVVTDEMLNTLFGCYGSIHQM